MDEIKARFRVDRSGFTLDVDLTFPNRGVTALFGVSGSGKTTLLRCIAGLERAVGTLQVKGAVWQDEKTFMPTHQRPLGYVFQEASLFPHLTVLDNLRYGMKRIAHADQKSLDQAIALLGIAPLLARKPDRLSGGERQRVGIARALAVNPRILLMDEPLAALDLKRKQEILPYLEHLHRELDIPVLYVSHALDEVVRLADHLILLEQGRVIAQGALHDTLSRLDLPLAQLEEASVMIAATLGAHDAAYCLSRLDFDGGVLWVSAIKQALGTPVRARILARDVSLATVLPQHSSINNILTARVLEIQRAEADKVSLKLSAGNTVILARITRRSCDTLGLTVGMKVYAQIKSVVLNG